MMALHLALLLLTSTCVSASPTIVELLNSVGLKYVALDTGPLAATTMATMAEETEEQRQTTCRDCTQEGRLFWDMFNTTTTAAPLPCCAGTSTCAKCGVEKTRRVIGGTETAAGVYPWIAALKQDSAGLAFCSGTLVSSRWVVTAAHCIFGSDALSVVLGEHDISSTNDADDTNRQVLVTCHLTSHLTHYT